MNQITRTIIFAGALTLSLTARADTVRGTSNDPNTCFVSADGTISNINRTNLTTVKWGTRSSNVLQFVPSSVIANTDGGQFKIGTFRWCNAKCYDQNGTIDMNFQAGLGFGVRGSGTLNFDLKYVESASTRGYNDFFRLPTSANAGQATIDGRLYTVRLAGFGNQTGNGYVQNNTWYNAEGGTSCLDVYGELQAQPVPEPATLAILGIGGLGLLRRKRARR